MKCYLVPGGRSSDLWTRRSSPLFSSQGKHRTGRFPRARPPEGGTVQKQIRERRLKQNSRPDTQALEEPSSIGLASSGGRVFGSAPGKTWTVAEHQSRHLVRSSRQEVATGNHNQGALPW